MFCFPYAGGGASAYRGWAASLPNDVEVCPVQLPGRESRLRDQPFEKPEPLIQALLDAGIMRLRPVLITVGATVIALFPLASHGGPLWEPMCYAQIGGLSVATFITLLLVPVIYAIFVLDLKLVQWDKPEAGEATTALVATTVAPAE